MNLPYARVTISVCDVAVFYTCAPCLYLKNDVARGLSISKNSKWPHYRGPCKCKHMQSCSWDLSLAHLVVVSSLRQLWMCSTLLHTTHTCECESPGGLAHPLDPLQSANLQRCPEVSETPSVMRLMNTLIIILCASAFIISRKVALCLLTYNMHEVPKFPS